MSGDEMKARIAELEAENGELQKAERFYIEQHLRLNGEHKKRVELEFLVGQLEGLREKLLEEQLRDAELIANGVAETEILKQQISEMESQYEPPAPGSLPQSAAVEYCPVCLSRGVDTTLGEFVTVDGRLHCRRCQHVIHIHKNAWCVPEGWRPEEEPAAECVA